MNYDAVLKTIVHSAGNRLTPLLTGARPKTLLNVEFKSVEERTPDLLTRLDDGRIFHLELQASNDPLMVDRMLHYRSLLRARYRPERITQHVLYVGSPTCSMVSHIKEEDLDYRFQLTDIRQFDEEVLLNSESPADRALAILSPTRNHRATIRRILLSWAGRPRRERADLMEKLMILSGLRRLDNVVAEEIRSMPLEIDIMENATIRGWIEQGLAKGMEKGREIGLEKGLEQGREQGLEIGQSTLLLKMLNKRFGKVPATVEKKIRKAHMGQLERWALNLMDANSLKEVFAEK